MVGRSPPTGPCRPCAVAALLAQATHNSDPNDPAEYANWLLLGPHLARALTETAPRLPWVTVIAPVDAATVASRGLNFAGDYFAGRALATLAAESATHRLVNAAVVTRAVAWSGWSRDGDRWTLAIPVRLAAEHACMAGARIDRLLWVG
jgi:hypothetical protein